MVEKQQDVLVDLLADHRAELEEKIQTRSRRFASKPIERQYHINAGFKELTLKIQHALGSSEVVRATELTDTLLKQIEEHEENLVIADSSPHGWLAVSKLRSGQELPKSLRKRLAQVEREIESRRPRQQYGFNRRRTGQIPREGEDVVTRRTNRRISPEEALAAASRSIRPGNCVHCHKGLHYYKECPDFWKKVQDSREAQVKGQAASTN